MAYKQTCPECGSDRIVTDARVMLNTMEFKQFCYDGSYDCCMDCGAEDIQNTVEIEVPDEPEKPSIARVLSSMIDDLVEVHAEENGELASSHGGDAPRPGIWPEGCSYCRAIVDGLEALGDIQRLNFLRGLYPVEPVHDDGCPAVDGFGCSCGSALVEVVEVAGGDGWMVLVDGFQWGDDPNQFDYALGCSQQTWPTREEAEKASTAAR